MIATVYAWHEHHNRAAEEEGNFMSAAKIVALDRKSYHILLRRAPGDGIAGGRTYDAVIAACVFKAKAATLLTFNKSHFLPFVDRGIEVVVPGGCR